MKGVMVSCVGWVNGVVNVKRDGGWTEGCGDGAV